MKVFADDNLAIGWRITKKSPPQTSLTVFAKAVLKLEPGVCQVMPVGDETVIGDIPYDGDPAQGNRYESDFAPFKPRADVLLVGAAHAPGGKPVPRFSARLRVGKIDKAIEIIGPRTYKS